MEKKGEIQMKVLKSALLLIAVLALMVSCSSDPIQQGDDALKNNNFNAALKYYMEAYKAQPSNEVLKAKIAQTYLLQGKDLYSKRKVITTIESRYEKALTFLPDNPDDQTKQLLSEVLTIIGKYYYEAKPQNEIQKREYLNKTYDYLTDAMFYNENNNEAQTLLEEYKKSNFEAMLTKGKEYFNRARKEKNDYFYLSAEYYLQKATEFDQSNDEALALLKKVRKINLNKIDPDQPYPFAVTNLLTKDDILAVSIYLLNNTDRPHETLAGKFVLYDINGNEYIGKTTEDFEPVFKEGSIPPRKDMEGVIVFEGKNLTESNLQKIVYHATDNRLITKYFPN